MLKVHTTSKSRVALGLFRIRRNNGQNNAIRRVRQAHFLYIRLHTAINWADFVSWCMLYTYDGNKMHS